MRLNNAEFILHVAIVTKADKGKPSDDSSNEEYHDFNSEDMLRVLDFDNMPEPPPSDAVFGDLEFELDNADTVTEDAPSLFPKRYFVLQGSCVFCFRIGRR